MAWSEPLRPSDQPYNIIFAGNFKVGKTSLFKKLSSGVHGDYQFSTVGCNSSKANGSQNFGKWTHTARVNGDTVKVLAAAM